MNRLAVSLAAAAVLAGCSTMDEAALAERSTVNLCEIANIALLDGSAAERVLAARHGEAWLANVKADQAPHVGDHICVAIYAWGPTDSIRSSGGPGWRSTQYGFGYRYLYADAYGVITGYN